MEANAIIDKVIAPKNGRPPIKKADNINRLRTKVAFFTDFVEFKL